MRRSLIAALATAGIMFIPRAAHSFREWVLPECKPESEDLHHADRYRDCLYKLMHVESAEALQRRGVSAFRLLNITDSPATPVFVQFARAPGRSARLTIASADADVSPLVRRISETRWRNIEMHWLMGGAPTGAKKKDVAPQTSDPMETVCLPNGSMEVEFILRGSVSRLSPDLCDANQSAFALFLREQAVSAVGSCAGASGDVPDSPKLLGCLSSHRVAR